MSNAGIIKKWMTGLMLVGLVVYGAVKIVQIRHLSIKNISLPIKYVRTEGEFQYLGKNEIKTALQPLVTTSFFDVDMQAMHSAVSTLPWVETVTIKRIWPDTIDVKIREKKPYTRWRQNSLITEQGVVFTPKNVDQFQTLTLVTGPDHQEVKVLEITKGIKTALADRSLKMAEFSVNDRWSWKIKLVNGLEILLGRDEQLKKLQRFLKTLTVLGQEQVDAMAIVDLRYPNGFSVSWKSGTDCCDWKAIANPDNEKHAH